MAAQFRANSDLSKLSCLAVFAVTCASIVAIAFSPSQTPAQAWTVAANRATSVVRPVLSTRTSLTNFGAPETNQEIPPLRISREPALKPHIPHDSNATPVLIGVAALVLGGAVALSRRYFQSVATPIALMASTSESKDDSKEKMRQMVEKLDSSDMRLLARGGSMDEVVRSKGIDEVAAAIRADQISRKDLSPKDVILELQRGNGRFWMGLSERPDMSAMERRALIMAQAPKVAILSCSDSRVPVEVIFDQGLGEVFVVRMAGNILNENAEGSIEFAVKYLGVKVVMVIGHEGCGAVKGAITMSSEDIAKEPKDLQTVLNNIKSKLDVNELNSITDSRSRDREAIVLNTSNQVKILSQNKLFAERVADGSLLVCGAFYEISSGIVDLFSLDKNGFVVDM